MKKIELLYITVAKNCVSSSCTFFHQLLKIDMWNTYGILFSVEQMTFFCRADDIFEKSVEQLRFVQMHFEQLTLTQQLLQIFVKGFPLNFCSRLLILMNGASIMVSSVGGLNPRPPSHESSALTARPRLLATRMNTYYLYEL